MKKLKKIGLIIICAVLIAMIIFVIKLDLNNTKGIGELFLVERYSSLDTDTGYTIYLNGVIKNNNKTDKLSEKELEQVKDLVSKIDVNVYEEHDTLINSEVSYWKKVYNYETDEWITLESSSGYNRYRNKSSASNELLELVDKLYKEYLSE